MSIPVKLKDIVEALEMTTDSISYYLDKRTGQIEMISEDITAAMHLEDDQPLDDRSEWLRESISKAREIQDDEGENFVELPDKIDIHDYRIMEDFSRTYPNDRVSAALLAAIRGKGAFRRFSSLVDEFSIQNKWHQFQQKAYEEIAIDWLEANGIPYTRGDEIEVDREM
jgi:predicted phosphoadenosine phosphosulfate sulfurtransferase